MLLIYPSIIHDNERLELQVSFRQQGIMGRGSSSMGKGEGSSFVQQFLRRAQTIGMEACTGVYTL